MKETILALLTPAGIYLLILFLHLVLPARRVAGYVQNPETGDPLCYRLNGWLVTTVVILLWAGLCSTGVFSWTWLYERAWYTLTGASLLGVIYTLAVVLPAPSTGRAFLVDLFLGRVENPQYFRQRVDAKMYLYLAGATLLALNVLSALAWHTQRPEHNSGVYLHGVLLLFFVYDYLVFERVHLYTWDLFAERVGFKLGWGCLVFYPFFYPIGLWATADLGKPAVMDTFGILWLISSALVFLAGWVLARGANLQKYRYKRFPGRAFLGLEPQTLTGGNLALLCNGFWGLSRHINYLGEILMAMGLALSLGHLDLVWPWLYPLYYVLLLVPRERDDDRRCAEKYGPLWDRYREKVRYRIIPGVY